MKTAHRIYVLGSNVTQAQADACREALEAQFPRTRFDSEEVQGVRGVRIHLPKYEPEGERATAARTFADEWYAAECKRTAS